MTRYRAHLIVLAALLALCLWPAPVEAGDEDCYSIPVTWYSPTGIAGCTLDGPTDGIASTYPGDVAAANWCTYPWDDCGSVIVQSHDTGLTITVPVAMYCDCYTGTAQERLVDLTPGQVAALGLDHARGLFPVTVTPVSSAPMMLPNTGMIDGGDYHGHRLPFVRPPLSFSGRLK